MRGYYDNFLPTLIIKCFLNLAKINTPPIHPFTPSPPTGETN